MIFWVSVGVYSVCVCGIGAYEYDRIICAAELVELKVHNRDIVRAVSRILHVVLANCGHINHIQRSSIHTDFCKP